MRPLAGDGGVAELLRAGLAAVRVPEGARPERTRWLPLWTMAQATARLQQQIGSIPEGSALAAFLPRIGAAAPDRELRCNAAPASTLLAGLKLARNGTASDTTPSPC